MVGDLLYLLVDISVMAISLFCLIGMHACLEMCEFFDSDDGSMGSAGACSFLSAPVWPLESLFEHIRWSLGWVTPSRLT